MAFSYSSGVILFCLRSTSSWKISSFKASSSMVDLDAALVGAADAAAPVPTDVGLIGIVDAVAAGEFAGAG